MNISTVIGLFGGIAVMIIGILWAGQPLLTYYDTSSVFIVIGGTLCGTLLAYPLNVFIGAFKAAGAIFSDKKADIQGAINTIIELANTARKEGLLFLEDSVKNLGDPFLQKGILLIIDGTDPELVKGILETELDYIEQRHSLYKGVFDTMAALGPAFGMLGTLIGLIAMLKNLSDPAALGPGMAVALITTFYGSIIANMICTPIAIKLKEQTDRELLYKTVLIEGMLSIQAGENPRIIEEKLVSFLPAGERRKLEADNEA